MSINKMDEDLNLVFRVRVDLCGFDNNIHATSGAFVCFSCGKVGHLV